MIARNMYESIGRIPLFSDFVEIDSLCGHASRIECWMLHRSSSADIEGVKQRFAKVRVEKGHQYTRVAQRQWLCRCCHRVESSQNEYPETCFHCGTCRSMKLRRWCLGCKVRNVFLRGDPEDKDALYCDTCFGQNFGEPDHSTETSAERWAPSTFEADPLADPGMDPWATTDSQALLTPSPSSSKRKPRGRREKGKLNTPPTKLPAEPTTPKPAVARRLVLVAEETETPEKTAAGQELLNMLQSPAKPQRKVPASKPKPNQWSHSNAWHGGGNAWHGNWDGLWAGDQWPGQANAKAGAKQMRWQKSSKSG